MLRGGRVDDCRRDKAVSLTDNKRVLFYAKLRKIVLEKDPIGSKVLERCD